MFLRLGVCWFLLGRHAHTCYTRNHGSCIRRYQRKEFLNITIICVIDSYEEKTIDDGWIIRLKDNGIVIGHTQTKPIEYFFIFNCKSVKNLGQKKQGVLLPLEQSSWQGSNAYWNVILSRFLTRTNTWWIAICHIWLDTNLQYLCNSLADFLICISLHNTNTRMQTPRQSSDGTARFGLGGKAK